MYRSTKKKVVRRTTVSAIAALALLGAGTTLAQAASTHTVKHQAVRTTTRHSHSSGSQSALPANCVGGKVTAVTSSSITVQNPFGTTTYTIDGSTTFTNDGVSATAADVTVGEHVRITLASPYSTTATNVNVDTRRPDFAGPDGARPPFTGGDVTAVSSTSITVQNPSGTTTFTIDGSTTFTKDGASATAADVTVGSRVHVTVSPTAPGTALAINIETHQPEFGGPDGVPPFNGAGPDGDSDSGH
jgi:Domain of unknown function (DUF5666)